MLPKPWPGRVVLKGSASWGKGSRLQGLLTRKGHQAADQLSATASGGDGGTGELGDQWVLRTRIGQGREIADDDREAACELLQAAIEPGKETNCWLAKDSSVSTPHGTVGTPGGGTVAVHHLVVVDAHAWTVTLDVWARGGGA